jgi:PAS domain S-box-containing protein
MKNPKARVLVVGQDSTAAREVVSSLKKTGYHVTGLATSGEQAISKAGSGHPDIVVIDGESNNTTIEIAQRLHDKWDLPIVLLIDEDAATGFQAAAPFAYPVERRAGRDLTTMIATALYRASGERAVREKQQWTTAVLDCMGDAVLIADCGGTVRFMNPVAEGLTGWSRDKAVGRPLSEVFHTIDEHNRERIESSEVRALHDDTELSEDTEDILLVSADGIERPIATTVSPINDAQGNLLGIVAVFRDVTARREVEKRAINREKMEALGKLSSSIAHDFNNIIGLVAGYAAAMQEYLIPNTRSHDDVKRILAAVDHAGALSKRILGVARASDMLWSVDVQSIMLSEVVEGAVSLLRDAFKQRSIEIENKVTSPTPFVKANRAHCVDLLVDILLNGAEAMANGGKITIDVRPYKLMKPDPKLNPRAKPGAYLSLRITDSGAGMTRETLNRLFEPFFTTKGTATHVGLGLSVVYNAIQNYGGWIKVTSEPQQGTTFSLFLPETAAETRRASPQPAKTAGSILVVDDDLDTRTELHDTLKQAGFKVHMATGGEEAISLYRTLGDQVDLAIIDVIMPGKSGKKVLEEVLKINPTAAVIMLCGFSREHVRSFLPSGPWRFVQKPVDPETILGAVRRAFELKTP